jgi:hypothetical protein
MTSDGQAAMVAGGASAITRQPDLDPAPLVGAARNWTRYAAPLLTLLMLGAVFVELRHLDVTGLAALVPVHPLFWAVFAVGYMVTPLSEWLIFRRLWDLPVGGLAALLRKRVSNELLLGYSGEAYFYAWARQHARLVAAPFGAIKDVAILSALAGNAFTLVMVLIAAPFAGPLIATMHFPVSVRTFAASAAMLTLISFGIMLLRTSLFTLPRRDLVFITLVHGARIIAAALLTALMWHLLLPGVALIWWVVLSALRQLLSRLPFLPNKDVAFAAMAVFFVGRETQIVAGMAVMATLIVSAHLASGLVLGVSGLLRKRTA